jgi:hypothetical protein
MSMSRTCSSKSSRNATAKWTACNRLAGADYSLMSAHITSRFPSVSAREAISEFERVRGASVSFGAPVMRLRFWMSWVRIRKESTSYKQSTTNCTLSVPCEESPVSRRARSYKISGSGASLRHRGMRVLLDRGPQSAKTRLRLRNRCERECSLCFPGRRSSAWLGPRAAERARPLALARGPDSDGTLRAATPRAP